MEPKVSIIIPCRNAAPWLEDALRTADGQTWPEIEIIFVDDGSSDESLAIAKRHETSRMKILSGNHGSASTARNIGLREAQGDYIQFLDADDLLAADKIEQQLVQLRNYDDCTIGVSSIIHFQDGQPCEVGTRNSTWPMADTDDPVAWLIEMYGPAKRGGMIQTGQWLTPRNVIETTGPWNADLTLDDDGEYFCRAVLASNAIRFAPFSFTYYRKHPSAKNLSAMGHKSRRHQESGLRAIELKEQHLLSRRATPEARDALARHYFEYAFVSYPKYPDLTDRALNRGQLLSKRPFHPHFPTARASVISMIFGWRVARRFQVWWHERQTRELPHHFNT